jgi:serine/threonine protein kinase/Tol biopolymer transport system component
MALAPSTRLGPYEVLSSLGAGGMGEVYRAKDTRLERTVAIKVLPEHLASNPDLRQRFEREARTVSGLNHPHICVLHDIGQQDGTDYLVLEYLEGETLADRLRKGPLPLDQALRYGTQIADALDKAHRHGVIHRDLKPGNVMLTKSGAKLLDFGLARKAKPVLSSEDELSGLATQAKPLTGKGTLLGTVQYMAPEQIEGREADARTDLWAFGALLYEMVTGRRAFEGGSGASLIGSILKDEPRPIRELKPLTPPSLERLARTCLAKDPDERWQNAHDLVAELRWIAETESTLGGASQRAASASWAWLPWTIAMGSILAALVLAFFPRHAPLPEARRLEFSIDLPEGTTLTDFLALSPDGRMLAFAAIVGGRSLLCVRDLASEELRTLPGTDSPESVFWSPDSRSVGFVSRGKLRRMEVATGSIEVIADAEAGRGGSWGVGDDILFAQKAVGAIYRVPASGGPVTVVTSFESGDLLHRWPQILPDGKRFLFYVRTGNPETTGTYLGTIGSAGRKLVLRNGATGVFAPPDTLLFGRGSMLLAQGFDQTSGQLLGTPQPLARPVMRAEMGSYKDLFAVSDTGILVFRPGGAERQLQWFDRRGELLRRVGQPGVIVNVSLSPDGRLAGVSTRAPETGNYSTTLVDLERETSTPFVESAIRLVWAPDGRSVLYRHEGESFEIRRRATRGDTREESVGVVDSFATPHTISPDGRYVLYTRMGGNFDVGVVDLEGREKPAILLGSPFAETNPHFSPDGRWFAYSSDEPGQSEIFVRRFPITDEAWRVSTSGGSQPDWSRDGKEIFFLSLDGNLMTAPVSAGATLSLGAPQRLFRTAVRLLSPFNQYAVSADGKRFLMAATQDLDARPFRVLVNWRSKP